MYQYKSEDDKDIEQERHDLIWQMLTAQLASSHEKLMTQYGMETASSVLKDDESLLRGPRRQIAPASAPADPRQLPPPDAFTIPPRGGR